MIEARAFASTKIVCTIGPASASVDVLVRLIEAGMDVARLNFSHGTHDDHRTAILNVREASRRTGQPVAILQDLCGPKIRAGAFKDGSVTIQDGATFVLTTANVEGTAERVSTTYRELPGDVKAGDVILLDDGKLSLRVVRAKGEEVETTVVHGGVLSSHKGMNLPGVAMSIPSLTEKDVDDAKFGVEHGIDYVALSFVRSPEDVRQLKQVLRKATAGGSIPPVVAKIEKEEAVDGLEGILAEADCIMVARGDLGVEMPPEDVPVIQKSIVRACNKRGVPVIIATQMLESMIGNPRPTRAEATDVANAVLDGADAVMLSAETSVGAFPVETVQTMDRIVRRAETIMQPATPGPLQCETEGEGIVDAVARSACVLSAQVGAGAIIAVTHSGATAMRISRYRPHARILAVTMDERVARRLNLVWGVSAIVFAGPLDTADAVMGRIRQEVVKRGIVKSGEKVVWALGMPLMAKGSTDTIKVEEF